jgi:hypothetical protein
MLGHSALAFTSSSGALALTSSFGALALTSSFVQSTTNPSIDKLICSIYPVQSQNTVTGRNSENSVFIDLIQGKSARIPTCENFKGKTREKEKGKNLFVGDDGRSVCLCWQTADSPPSVLMHQ